MGWSEVFLCSLDPGCSALLSLLWVEDFVWSIFFLTLGKIAFSSKKHRSPGLLDPEMWTHPLPFSFPEASSTDHAQKDLLRGTLP